MVTVLAAIAVLLTLPALVDLIRRPDLRRVGLRNIVRRPGEAALVVLGSALGTAIIAAAFIVGDTFDRSIRDIARTELGPVDQVVRVTNVDDLDDALVAIEGPGTIAGVDGVLAITSIGAALSNADATNAEPSLRISAVDMDAARSFGADPSITALADVPAPGLDEIVINTDTRAELDVEIGDLVAVYAYGERIDLELIALMPSEGLGGFSDAYIDPALLDSVAAEPPLGAEPPSALVLVSNDGGVFDSTEDPRNVRRIETATGDRLRAAGIDHDQSPQKLDILRDAEEEGDELTQIFSVVGGFSVVAGILLLVNLFVMLAEERKPTMGVLRAIGWRQGTLVRSFGLEGAIYAIIAAAVGALGGIGVGWAVVKLTQDIFATSGNDFSLILAVEPISLLQAALTGLVISLLAIWVTSWRISRLNIIRAIRDLPEPVTARGQLLLSVGGLVLAVVGVALLIGPGLGGKSVIPALAGPALMILGAGLLLKRWVRNDLLAVAAGSAVVLWGAFWAQILPKDVTTDVELPTFLVLGIILVAGGTAIATVIGPWMRRLLDLGSRPATAARLGLAYPVARTFRTALSLAMFSLIIFSLTFISVMSSTLGGQDDDIVTEISAGRDMMVDANSANPIATGDLTDLPGVASASPIIRAVPRWSADFDAESIEDPDRWRLSGIDPGFGNTGAPQLELRADRFATDAEAFEAVATDPTLVVVPSWFLAAGSDGVEVNLQDRVTMYTASGFTQEMTVIGVVQNDFTFAGPWVSADLVREQMPGGFRITRHYVTATADTSADDLAEAIDAAFVTNGASAETFRHRVGRFLSQELGFFRLLRGYLALGLVIGIAGLGVTLVRAVRERRREIGMLRSMGFPTGGVRSMFLTEAAFIGFLGIVSGAALGLLTARQLISGSDALDEPLPFVFPTSALVLVVLLPLIGAVVAAIVPAIRAARLRPSEALRLAD